MAQGMDRVRARPGNTVAGSPVAPGSRRSRNDEPRPRRKSLTPLGWVSVGLTGVLVAGTLGGYAYYRSILAGLEQEDIVVDATRPPETGALNVLLVGSDSREGDNKKYGPKSQGLGERTDTIMLLHISPNRDKATMISFPRDSMVQVPQCTGHNGTVIGPGIRQINAAFNDGGINCTIKTLESLTNIKIN